MELRIKEKNNGKNSVVLSNNSQKDIWISTTGYRIFLVFKSLLESPKTLEELLEIVKNDAHLKNKVSKDTIRFDINTLRNAGCTILTPIRANHYKYSISYHPFKLNIYDDEMDILLELRDNIAQELSLNEVFILNDLFNKIAALTFEQEKIDFIKNSAPLVNINRNILNELLNPNIINKKVQIKYKSPEFGEENIDVIPFKILYENKKVYLFGYNYKYKNNSFFELPKILKINAVSLKEEKISIPAFSVIYEVKGNSLYSFNTMPYEKIIDKTDSKITVQAEVENEFMFTQRLFLLGRDFRIVLPDFFRERLINKIELIQKRYINGES